MTIHSTLNLKTNHDDKAYFYGHFEPKDFESGRKIFEFFCGFLRLCGGQFTCTFDESVHDNNIQWRVQTLDANTKKVADQWIAFNSINTLNGFNCHSSDENLERTFITKPWVLAQTLNKQYELDASKVSIIEPNKLMDLIDLRSKELKDKIKSFTDFYIFYLQEHSKQGTRFWHMVGTAGAISCFSLGLFTSGWFFLAAPLAGYIPAWVSHFKIEENKPATWLGIKEIFKSLGCDFLMSGNKLKGTLNEDLWLAGINPEKK